MGRGILARRIVERAEQIEDEQNPGKVLLMAVGIREPEEVRVLRAEWGESFLLLAVKADSLVRAKRKALRNQYRDDAEHTEILERADQDIGILPCVSMADWCLVNDDNLEQLESAVATFFQQHVAPLLEGTSDRT